MGKNLKSSDDNNSISINIYNIFLIMLVLINLLNNLIHKFDIIEFSHPLTVNSNLYLSR